MFKDLLPGRELGELVSLLSDSAHGPLLSLKKAATQRRKQKVESLKKCSVTSSFSSLLSA